ncbi:hypothetical protein VPHK469_0073 [Vibrio phage K469]
MVEQFIIEALAEKYPSRKVTAAHGHVSTPPDATKEVVKVVAHDKRVYDVQVLVNSDEAVMVGFSMNNAALYG